LALQFNIHLYGLQILNLESLFYFANQSQQMVLGIFRGHEIL